VKNKNVGDLKREYLKMEDGIEGERE